MINISQFIFLVIRKYEYVPIMLRHIIIYCETINTKFAIRPDDGNFVESACRYF